MRCRSAVTAAFGILTTAAALAAQTPQPSPAPWRGAGSKPCVGSDGGFYQCPPAPRVVAVRAGRLFDANADRLTTKQVVRLQGVRITAIGPGGHVRKPAGCPVNRHTPAPATP